MSNPQIPAGAVDLAERSRLRDAEEKLQREQREEYQRAIRAVHAVAWVKAMKRAFKGTVGAPNKNALAKIAREKFRV